MFLWCRCSAGTSRAACLAVGRPSPAALGPIAPPPPLRCASGHADSRVAAFGDCVTTRSGGGGRRLTAKKRCRWLDIGLLRSRDPRLSRHSRLVVSHTVRRRTGRQWSGGPWRHGWQRRPIGGCRASAVQPTSTHSSRRRRSQRRPLLRGAGGASCASARSAKQHAQAHPGHVRRRDFYLQVRR